MILRFTATLVLLAGFGAFSTYLHMLGRFPTASVEARHLRAMKDRVNSPDSARATTYEAMSALPRNLSVGEYSGIELSAVSLEGYVQRMVRAADDDVHIELVPTKRMPGEPNLRYVTAEITPQWRRGSERWRWPRLVELFHPNFGGTTLWEGGTQRVRLTGLLLYDYEYEGAPAHGRARLASWELHPVTRIERWDDARGAFVEYPR